MNTSVKMYRCKIVEAAEKFLDNEITANEFLRELQVLETENAAFFAYALATLSLGGVTVYPEAFPRSNQ